MVTSRTDGAAARSRRWCELDDWAVSEYPVQTGSRDGDTLNTTHERNVCVIDILYNKHCPSSVSRHRFRVGS